jgi:transcriptional regulator with XRE-family HTH domain
MSGTYVRIGRDGDGTAQHFRDSRDSRAARPSARLVLGARLRRLREAAGVSCEDAGRAIRGSGSKISRLELGRTRIKSRDAADLLTRYGVTDEAERATLLALAEHANAASWWQEYADVVPAWLEQYLELERAAGLIRTYQVQVIPGLLQTEDYCRAIVRSARPDAPDDEIERRVELRMARQQILHRDDPVRLWAVIDEASLLRPVGGTAVMRAQLRYLIEAARLPNVNIQILPLSAGAHAAEGGCLALLRFSEAELPDVVYLEQLFTAIYLNKPADTAPYWDVLNRLVAEAEPPAAAAAALDRILRDG